MRNITRVVGVTSLLLVCLIAFAQSPPSNSAEVPPGDKARAVGLSPHRLHRIGEAIQAGIDSGDMPGAVVLVARRGEVAYLKAFGMQNDAHNVPMRTDTIFRIASMTKPIVAVGVMMLQEEGKLALVDPVSKYLPALEDLEVAVEKYDPETGKSVFYTVPAKREITVHDLLRHTSGIIYGVGTTKIAEMYRKVDVGDRNETSEELVEKLGRLPLANQPGEVWEYGYSYDVLGRLIEVVSGMPLDEFLEKRVFTPLGMNDTGFYVPESKQDRIAQGPTDPDTGEPVELPNVKSEPVLLAGGGGLVSTARDYYRFLQMLLNGGELDGTRLLGPKTVEYMTVNHLAPLSDKPPRGGAVKGFVGSQADQSALPGVGYGGYGLGFAVRTSKVINGNPGTVGEYYWSGGYGTYFWVDPKEELIAIYMSQDGGSPKRAHYRRLFHTLVTASIIDTNQ